MTLMVMVMPPSSTRTMGRAPRVGHKGEMSPSGIAVHGLPGW